MSKIAIIDYGLGNLFSVEQVCRHLGHEPQVTSDPAVLMDSDGAILPGVGAFGDAMANLSDLDLVSPIRDYVAQDRPFLGVCLGLQLLFTQSEEFGNHQGLDIIPGDIVKFSSANDAEHKVPQIQWNQIRSLDPGRWQASLLAGCREGEYMYFVHSYFVRPKNIDVVVSISSYAGEKYCSSVQKGNLFACQFHPEKSGDRGVEIYRRFFDTVLEHKKR